METTFGTETTPTLVLPLSGAVAPLSPCAEPVGAELAGAELAGAELAGAELADVAFAAS